MRQVAVAGVGMTRFGKLEGFGVKELGEEAISQALMDAKMEPKQVEVSYVGNTSGGAIDHQMSLVGHLALKQVGISGIPITRVENACASAASAFREVWMAVASGLYDIGLAVGIEKMTNRSTEEVMRALSYATDVELEAPMGVTMPAMFAMIAKRHMQKFGTSREQIAMVPVKNRKNALANSRASFKKAITVDDVLNSPLVSEPLRLYDCCPISDGAAAAVLVPAEIAGRFTDTPVYIAGSGQASGVSQDEPDMVSFPSTIRAARKAFAMAKLEPKDVKLAEIHDCFSIAEIVRMEDIGFFDKGDGGRCVQDGMTEIGGKVAINTSGGLLSKGHPIGATGLAQIAEVVWQLRGEAGKRQVAGADVGLTQCQGGIIYGDGGTDIVHLLRR